MCPDENASGDDAIFDHGFNAQVAFNTSDWINDDTCHNPSKLLLIVCMHFCNHRTFADVGDNGMRSHTDQRGRA